MNPDTRFFDDSKSLAEEFLQTIVVVDDLADFGEKDSQQVAQVEEPPSRPGSKSSESSEKISRDPRREDDNEDILEKDSAHYLNAKILIDNLARKSIVCSVINPNKEDLESISGTLSNLASATDIMVLDWQIHKDNGDHALEMMGEVINADTGKSPNRLRLFVIYTGETDIPKIYDKINKYFRENFSSNNLEFKEVKDSSITFGSNRIVILVKPETKITENLKDQQVRFDDLPNRIIEEFTYMTAGLVSNVAIRSFAIIRNNTSRIINRFSSDLDAPYLSHRFMLPQPVDAEEHLTYLIAEELKGLLQEAQVGRSAGMEYISSWIGEVEPGELTLGERRLSQEDVLRILEIGVTAEYEISDNQIKNLHKKGLSGYFLKDEQANDKLDEQFAYLTIMRAHYEDDVPYLTLGTIIKDDSLEEPSYWICLQPKCDSVRIVSARSFPFIPLEKVSGDNKKFKTLLMEGGKFDRFKIQNKPFNIKLITFTPGKDDNQRVQASRENDHYIFRGDKGGNYIWMGELRSDHGFRLANSFSANMSRIGVDESEWLRRWSPGI